MVTTKTTTTRLPVASTCSTHERATTIPALAYLGMRMGTQENGTWADTEQASAEGFGAEAALTTRGTGVRVREVQGTLRPRVTTLLGEARVRSEALGGEHVARRVGHAPFAERGASFDRDRATLTAAFLPDWACCHAFRLYSPLCEQGKSRGLYSPLSDRPQLAFSTPRPVCGGAVQTADDVAANRNLSRWRRPSRCRRRRNRCSGLTLPTAETFQSLSKLDSRVLPVAFNLYIR